MFVPFSFIKYIAIWSVVFWPLHALGVRSGIAYVVAFASWVPAFEVWRRRRRRRMRLYEQLTIARLDTPFEADDECTHTSFSPDALKRGMPAQAVPGDNSHR
jgi:hypothetical protein